MSWPSWTLGTVMVLVLVHVVHVEVELERTKLGAPLQGELWT